MMAWKEAALQREQENARLLDLNNVRLDPKFTKITGVVLADSGSPFRQNRAPKCWTTRRHYQRLGRDGWYWTGGPHRRRRRAYI